MKVEHTLLKQGPCPFCERRIIEKDGKQNQYYKEFWVKFNDGSNAAFAVCSDCYENLDRGKIEKLVSSQIWTWGQEILKQQAWFVNTACHLRLNKFGKTKEEL